MSRTLTIWRKLLSPFDWLEKTREKKRIEKSFGGAFFGWRFRDDLCYYENGRRVTLWAELLATKKYQRMIARDPILKWDDNGQILTPEEKQKVLGNFHDYLAQNRITWIYSDDMEKLYS
jgi:hypothetical protein